MRRTILLAGVLLAVMALGSDLPKEYDDRTTFDPLEGTWQLIQTEYKGVKQHPDFVMILRGGGFAFKWSNGETTHGNYHIDPTRKPPHLDWISSYGYECLYLIDGSTLRIADGRPGQRPQGFNDQNDVIETYKRVK